MRHPRHDELTLQDLLEEGLTFQEIFAYARIGAEIKPHIPHAHANILMYSKLHCLIHIMEQIETDLKNQFLALEEGLRAMDHRDEHIFSFALAAIRQERWPVPEASTSAA